MLEVVQIDPDFRITEAVRGRARLTYPEPSDDAPWHLLPPLNMISATYSVGDTELPLARFVMPY